MESRKERAAFAALNRTYGSSPKKAHALLERYGSAVEIPGLKLDGEEEELDRLEGQGHRFITCRDPRFPALLKETPDCPVGLYVTGTSGLDEIFGYERAVSIVGTRNITEYGTEWCRKIVLALSRCNIRPVIVSGFAFGTDILAQTEALRNGLQTIGVMPCGPDNIYPSSHRDIAYRLFETAGCALVTDYPPGTTAYAANFIRRNRIIAGLSDAVILIESRRRGGGLITMDFALDYGRDTYALPGRVNDPCSEGCNILIRRNKAALISDPESLVESLGLELLYRQKPHNVLRKAAAKYGAESLHVRILAHVRKNGGITPDELCRELNRPYPACIDAVIRLQGDGWLTADILQRLFIKE